MQAPGGLDAEWTAIPTDVKGEALAAEPVASEKTEPAGDSQDGVVVRHDERRNGRSDDSRSGPA